MEAQPEGDKNGQDDGTLLADNTEAAHRK